MVRYALSATSQILISARARKNGAEGGGGRHAFLRVSHGATVAPDTKRDARTHRSHAAPQSDSAHHSRTRHAWRKDGRTEADDGGTDGEEGRGRDHFEGTVPRHAHATRARSRARPLPPQLSLSLSISPFPLSGHIFYAFWVFACTKLRCFRE